MKIFTSLPEDLASLSDDDLAALAAKIRAEIADARENIEDLIGQHGREEVLAAVKAAVEAVESLTEVQGERDAEAAKFEADLAGLLGRVAEEEAAEETEEAAEEAEAVEPVAEVEETVEEAAEEKVAVTASAKPAAKRRVAPPVGRSREAAPPEQKTERVPLVASADVPGAPAGMPFKSRRDLIEAIIRKREAIGNVPQGFEDRVIVASARAPFGREQMLSGDPQQSDERIAEALGAPSSPRALTASGGIAAPAQVLYDIINYAVADRPFRDGLPRFGADRGRVSFSRPQALSVGAGATGILTIADDAAATSKPVLTISAPSTVTVEIESVSQIVKIGNLHARTWPEQVDHHDFHRS